MAQVNVSSLALAKEASPLQASPPGAPKSCSTYISQVDKSGSLCSYFMQHLECWAALSHHVLLLLLRVRYSWDVQHRLIWTGLRSSCSFQRGLTELSKPWGRVGWGSCRDLSVCAASVACACHHEPSRERQGFITATPGPRNYWGSLQLCRSW